MEGFEREGGEGEGEEGRVVWGGGGAGRRKREGVGGGGLGGEPTPHPPTDALMVWGLGGGGCLEGSREGVVWEWGGRRGG